MSLSLIAVAHLVPFHKGYGGAALPPHKHSVRDESGFATLISQNLHAGVDKVQAGAVDLEAAISVQESFGECPAMSRLPLQRLMVCRPLSVNCRNNKGGSGVFSGGTTVLNQSHI